MHVSPSCPEVYQQEAIEYLNSILTDQDIIVLQGSSMPQILIGPPSLELQATLFPCAI